VARVINLLAKEDSHMSLKEFLCSRFYRDGGWELCKGELVLMSPARESHSHISSRISHLFQSYIEAKNLLCKAYDSDAALRLWDDDSFIQPDVSICCDQSKIMDGWFLSVPEIVIEVLSDSTKKYDLGEKLEIYKAFGAKEYWAVDIEQRQIRVEYFDDDVMRIYRSGDMTKSRFFSDLEIPVDDVFKYL
jgi:Uma2 family endonuclease